MEQTTETCGTCSRKLVKCERGHYVCTGCEKNHPCGRINKAIGFTKINDERRARRKELNG